MARIGYARVNSDGQSLTVQLDKLSACDKIYQEKKSGATRWHPSLAACLDYVREGNTLVVTRLGRLARSTLHLCEVTGVLHRKGVELQVLDQQISTTDATRRLLFHMLGPSRNSRPRSAPSGSATGLRTRRHGGYRSAAAGR